MPVSHDLELRLNPRRLLIGLLAFNTLLVGLSLGALVGFKLLGDQPWLLNLYLAVNIDAERNVPAVYSALQLLAAAGLLGLVAVAQTSVAGGAPRRFGMLAGLFVLLAADEAFSFHEAMGGAMHGQLQLTGPISGCWTWVIAGAPIVLVTGLCFLPLLWKLHRRTRGLVVLAATLFIGGALGLETVGGIVRSYHGVGGAYYLVTALEEWCEMVGISVFVFALLRELSLRPKIRLSVATPSPQPGDTLFARLA
jgi:hypothetical protein